MMYRGGALVQADFLALKSVRITFTDGGGKPSWWTLLESGINKNKVIGGRNIDSGKLCIWLAAIILIEMNAHVISWTHNGNNNIIFFDWIYADKCCLLIHFLRIIDL